jgi:hypothetical protein
MRRRIVRRVTRRLGRRTDLRHRGLKFMASVLVALMVLTVLVPSGLMKARVYPHRLGRATAGLAAPSAQVPNVGPPWPPTV